MVHQFFLLTIFFFNENLIEYFSTLRIKIKNFKILRIKLNYLKDNPFVDLAYILNPTF